MASTLRGVLLVSCVLVLGCSGDEPARQHPAPPSFVQVIRPIQVSEKARFPESDPALDRVEVTADALTFYYKRAPTIPLEVGHVVAGHAQKGYLRAIESISTPSELTVRAATRAARMTELIVDGAFRVKTEPERRGGWRATASSAGASTG